MKMCTKCKESKPLEMFYKERNSKRPDCKACVDKRNKSRDPMKEKATKLKGLYGITLDDYNQMFATQNGNCAICKRNQSQFKKMLFVDHCHTTGMIRGLLCSMCNQAIGLLQDNVEIIKSAAKYLETR